MSQAKSLQQVFFFPILPKYSINMQGKFLPDYGNVAMFYPQ